MKLFDRKATLTIYRPIPGEFFKVGPNAIIIRDLRVVFSIVKDLDEEPNNCTIDVYNLSAASRAALQTKPLRVTLDIGYADRVDQIFAGDIQWVESTRDGIDWKTHIELGDGSRAYKHARVNRSFKPGTSGKQVVTELAKSMGLTVPKNVKDANKLIDQFVSGVSIEGPSAREMSRVMKKGGYTWSIQDGKLQALSDRETTAESIVIVSQANGMVGSPAYGSPPKEGESPILKVETLLDARIKPGRRIQVESQSTSGLFKVSRVTHAGDTHGPAWTTTVEAIPK